MNVMWEPLIRAGLSRLSVDPRTADRLSSAGAKAIDRLGNAVGEAMEVTVRLGVTGLRRAGKTVFVTSAIDNLLKGGRLGLLDAAAAGRLHAVRLRPQPDAAVPRFEYESSLRAIANPGHPDWPAPTRAISQTRVGLRVVPTSPMRRMIQNLTTVNLDIVDYPGEWLLDLPLMAQSYEAWSRQTLTMATFAPRDRLIRPFLEWLDTVDPDAMVEDAVADEGSRRFADYLKDCRDSPAGLFLVQPGRLLEPGELAGAPMLSFCPLPPEAQRTDGESLWALMSARFEAYKQNVVRRFFVDHFSRLDRQIVMVDLLGALTAGPAAFEDMRRALTCCLEGFRHGSGNWIERLTGRRIDRVLFAATKVDHIASGQHGNLRLILDHQLGEIQRAIKFEGATVETIALASVKCTETVITEVDGRRLSCVEGVPVGRDQPTVLFPGELFDVAQPFPDNVAQPYRFLSFSPPAGADRDRAGLPHIRLDQALQFLIGDYLQ